jgi:hypothetical protein
MAVFIMDSQDILVPKGLHVIDIIEDLQSRHGFFVPVVSSFQYQDKEVIKETQDR